MADETKISLFTFLGMTLTCFALGWLIRDNLDSIVPLVLFLVGILLSFGMIYKTVDGQRWEGIISMVREEFTKKK